MTNCLLSQAVSLVAGAAREVAHGLVDAAGGPLAPSQVGSIRRYSLDQPRIEQGDGRHARTGVTVPAATQWRAELGELPAFFGQAWEAQ